MKDKKPRLDHPFQRNQISMTTDTVITNNKRILDKEWFDEIYPQIFARIASIDPQLVRECAEVGRNTQSLVPAMREFTRKYLSQYMAQLPFSVEEEILDTEIRSSTEEPIYNQDGMRMNAPFLVEIEEIPETVTVQTDEGSADFSKREVLSMIRTSNPQF